MVTKAVHLEVVSGLDTRSFLHAFKRFISRRGLCSHVYSDCGKNFVGADAEIRELFNKNSVKSRAIVNNLILRVWNGTLILQLLLILEDCGRQQ